jgi:ABC-type Zn uptake system ZnuABC Zn-binding protein ZnuA
MVLNLKAGDRREAILMYLNILDGFHKLTPKEMELFAEIIMVYQDLLAKYDEEVANTLYLNTANRVAIKSKMKMADQVFRGYLSTFKSKGLITATGVKPVFLQDYTNTEIVISIKYDGTK